MIRQYYAQRRRGRPNPLGIGVISVGAIFYIQDEGWWRDRYRGAATCRNPWIVEAFLNGTIGAARRNRQTGLWEDVYAAGRSLRHSARPLAARRPPPPGRRMHPHPSRGTRVVDWAVPLSGSARYVFVATVRAWRAETASAPCTPLGHRTRPPHLMREPRQNLQPYSGVHSTSARSRLWSMTRTICTP
jgi:hypothetical protein